MPSKVSQKLKDSLTLGKDAWDPTHRFETSWFLPPWALFAFRLLFATYALTTRVVVLVWYCTHGQNFDAKDDIFYFTALTFWGLGFYLAVAAVHTATYTATGRPLLARFPRFLQALHSFFYTTVVSFPFLVSAVYWAILYDGYDERIDAWRSISQHGVNLFFCLFEILATRTGPLPWIHMLFVVVVMGMYLGLAYLREHVYGSPSYDFLDRGEKGPGGPAMVAAYCVGVFIATLVSFCLAKMLVWGRIWITEKKLHMHGKFAGKSAAASATSRDVEAEAEPKEQP